MQAVLTISSERGLADLPKRTLNPKSTELGGQGVGFRFRGLARLGVKGAITPLGWRPTPEREPCSVNPKP